MTQKGEYRMLLIDGHASHITTVAIEYCVQKKIILLCLPAHTTHILQPLDVDVFAPLTTAYKNNIHAVTRYGAAYSVDKVDFLKQYRLARNKAITPTNIQKAWKATGLFPFNPQLILKDFILLKEATERPLAQSYNITIRPTTPPEAVVSYNGPSGSCEAILTPANMREVQLLLDKLCKSSQVEAEILLKKVGKSAMLAMADSIIQNRTNEELIEHNKRKENKKKRKKGNNEYARHVNQEVVNERKADWNWDNEVKRLGTINKDIFRARLHARRLGRLNAR